MAEIAVIERKSNRVARNWRRFTVPFRKRGKPVPLISTVDWSVIVITTALSWLVAFHLDDIIYGQSQTLSAGQTTLFIWITDIGKSEWSLIPTGVFVLAVLLFGGQSGRQISPRMWH